MTLSPASYRTERDFAADDRRVRSSSDFVAALKRDIRVNADLVETVRSLAHELLKHLSAERVLIAARETGGGRAHLWSVGRTLVDGQPTLDRSELSAADADLYFFAAPACWGAVRHRAARQSDSVGIIVADGARATCLGASPEFIPERFSALHLRRACLAAAVPFGAEWECRIFVLDADVSRFNAAVRCVRRAATELGPAVHNVYVFHRLCAQAVAEERAALARALHDNLIQSLISAEMRVHAIRRQWPDAAATELLGVERILHEEILGVRDLMRRIKPIHLTADELLEFLDDHVQKFAGETGIAARFQSDVREVTLPAPMCTEVARVVQEALSNVRKHSGASNVVVRLMENANRWCLIVEDNGRGLGTRVASAATSRSSSLLRFPSPAVIKECVRSLQGELKLQSAAGGGLRLEITFATPGVVTEAPALPKAAGDEAGSHSVSSIMTALAATVDARFRRPAAHGNQGRSHVQ